MSASLDISLSLVYDRLVAASQSVSGGARLLGERALKRVSYRLVLLVIEKVFLDLLVALSDVHLAVLLWCIHALLHNAALLFGDRGCDQLTKILASVYLVEDATTVA